MLKQTVHLAIVLTLIALNTPIRASTPAQSTWTLTLVDFSQQRISIVGLTDSELVYRDPSGAAARLPIDRLLSVSRGSSPTAAATSLVLVARGGDRLAGTPLRMVDEQLTWKTSVGEQVVPIARVEGIVRGATELPVEPTTGDVARLLNGDRLQGVLSDFSESGLSMSSDGNLTTAPIESLEYLAFAPVSATVPMHKGLRVLLKDGSAVSARTLRIAGEEMTIESAWGAKATVAVADIEGIEHVGGPVLWLDAVRPGEQIQKPYLSGTIEPAVFGRTRGGPPFKVGDRTVARVIAATAYSKLTWPVPDGYSRFRTRFAIEGRQPLANVTVRVIVDGKVAYEKADVVTGPAGELVDLPLGQAKAISLEVDYGRNFDVQDRLLWIEPALVR